MRIINFLVATIFMVLAFLSVGKPYPVIWILIYGAMAVMAILAMFNLYIKKLIVALFILLLISSFYYLHSFILWIDHPNLLILFDEDKVSSSDFLVGARSYLALKFSELILVFYFVRSIMK